MQEQGEEPEVRTIGCQIVCIADVADEIAQQLRYALGEILHAYSEDEVIDYGVDWPPAT